MATELTILYELERRPFERGGPGRDSGLCGLALRG
jgi:hypothetical protein